MGNNVNEKVLLKICRKPHLQNIIMVVPKAFREVWFLFLLRSGLGKGLQIQQKYGFHQESDRKKQQHLQQQKQKEESDRVAASHGLFKFFNEVDVM